MANMTTTQKRKFVSLWSKEYGLTKKIQKLDDKIDLAYSLDLPYKRLQNSQEAAVKALEAVTQEIMDRINNGDFQEDAVTQCHDQLGELGGYVCDCYAYMYEDKEGA